MPELPVLFCLSTDGYKRPCSASGLASLSTKNHHCLLLVIGFAVNFSGSIVDGYVVEEWGEKSGRAKRQKAKKTQL
jgi:hypothetical protein